MPLMTGTVFLIPAILTCVLPIGLLIAFATFFTRQARRLPENATPEVTPTPSRPAGDVPAAS